LHTIAAVAFFTPEGRKMPRLLLLALVGCCSFATRGALAQEGPADRAADGQNGATPRQVPVVAEADREGTRLTRFDFLGSGPHHGFYEGEPVCTVPCRAFLSPGVSYRFVAPGMTPSGSFELSGTSEADVRVHGGSWAPYVTGVVLTILGAVYLPVGGGLFVGQEAFGNDKSRALAPVGATLLGVGLVSLAVGIPLWLSNRTSITIQQNGEVKTGLSLSATGITF
jgi:hypothetical protein